MGFLRSLLKRLEIPRLWVCQPHKFSSAFSFLLMKEAIAQIIWKGKSGIYYLGVPLPCCSYKFKLRFLRIRLNMTKIAVWAVELSTCRLIEPFVIMKGKGSLSCLVPEGELTSQGACNKRSSLTHCWMTKGKLKETMCRLFKSWPSGVV